MNALRRRASGRINDIARRRVKQFAGRAEVNVGKDHNQAQLAQDGSRFWIMRAPPNGPAETPHTPTALCMYSLRLLSSTMFEQSGKAIVVVRRHDEDEPIPRG